MPEHKQWKQPREDVTGADRDDYLLSLDDQAIAHREALRAMAFHLQTACMVGNPAPIVTRMSDRIRNPRPGDLVVESSTRYRHDPDSRLKAFGILLEHREEWWETDAEWEAYKAEDGTITDEDRRTDRAWYVQYGPDPGDVYRWVNCSFVVVPVGDVFDMPVGERDGGAVTFTRDGLLSGLADSGFELKAPTDA